MFNLAAVDATGSQTIPMISWLDQRAVHEAERLAGRFDRVAQARLFGSIITAKDVIRHELVARIVEAYDRASARAREVKE